MKRFNQTIFSLIAGLLILAGQVFAEAQVYNIDKQHSTVGFAVKHLQVSTVRGSFGDYAGSITLDPADPAMFNAEATIQVSSINTGVEGRDKHLRGGDFFDAEQFPTITFKSKKLDGTNLTGDLTIRGVTKEITFPVEISGPVNSPMGGSAIGLHGETKINRQDFGVSWSKNLDNGGLVVDDNVTLTIDIEAHNNPAAPEKQADQEKK
jgi:polyisoprenoid-binding protein YceI